MNKELYIRCGKETEYDVHTPITIRRYYIEGSGQLCEDCWRELYGRKNELHQAEKESG